ncbi:hydrolase [Paenibacillus curdlanolyticus]|nr:hydrolase [Paenibacillus curdlanolyticus]
MRVATGVEMLELTVPDSGMLIHPTVVYDEEGYVLIDTGLPGCRDSALNLISHAGLNPDKLRAIILTHQDIDHIGSLPQWLSQAKPARLDVYAHEGDRNAIDGKEPLLKVTPERMKGILQAMTESERQTFQDIFSGNRANVTNIVEDGQILPFGGGLKVIHTPGHTPGHISLYHEASQTLIAGDAMIVKDGELSGPNPPFTPNMSQALQSLRKLAEYPIQTVICYHGGQYSHEDVNERIAELAGQA